MEGFSYKGGSGLLGCMHTESFDRGATDNGLRLSVKWHIIN